MRRIPRRLLPVAHPEDSQKTPAERAAERSAAEARLKKERWQRRQARKQRQDRIKELRQRQQDTNEDPEPIGEGPLINADGTPVKAGHPDNRLSPMVLQRNNPFARRHQAMKRNQVAPAVQHPGPAYSTRSSSQAGDDTVQEFDISGEHSLGGGGGGLTVSRAVDHEGRQRYMPLGHFLAETQDVMVEAVAPRIEGVVIIDLKRAENLPALDASGKTDCFIRFQLGEATSDSKVVKNSLNPVFDQQITVAFAPGAASCLKIELFDYDLVGNNELIGCMTISLYEIFDRSIHRDRYFVTGRECERMNTALVMDMQFKSASGRRPALYARKSTRKIPQNDQQWRFDLNPVDLARQEVEVMSHLYESFDAFEDDNYFYLVSTLCKGGNLDHLFRAKKLEHIGERGIAALMNSLLARVDHMHLRHVVHGRIDPSNLVFEQENDFNSLQVVNYTMSMVLMSSSGRKSFDDVSSSSEKGPSSLDTFTNPNLMTKLAQDGQSLTCVAPELLKFAPAETSSLVNATPKGIEETNLTVKEWQAVDAYACGVVLYVLATGQPPHSSWEHVPERKFRSTITSVSSDKLQFPKKLSSGLKRLLSSLLHPDWRKRCSVHDALNNPWVLGERILESPPVKEALSCLLAYDVSRAPTHLAREVADLLAKLNMHDHISVKVIFTAFDKDTDGTLGPDELHSLMKYLCEKVFDDHGDNENRAITTWWKQRLHDTNALLSGKITEIQKEGVDDDQCVVNISEIPGIDLDGDGRVTGYDLRCAIALGRIASNEVESRAVFDMFDINLRGTIRFEELRTMLPALSEKQVRRDFQKVDVSGDSQISYEEWKLALRLTPSSSFDNVFGSTGNVFGAGGVVDRRARNLQQSPDVHGTSRRRASVASPFAVVEPSSPHSGDDGAGVDSGRAIVMGANPRLSMPLMIRRIFARTSVPQLFNYFDRDRSANLDYLEVCTSFALLLDDCEYDSVLFESLPEYFPGRVDRIGWAELFVTTLWAMKDRDDERASSAQMLVESHDLFVKKIEEIVTSRSEKWLAPETTEDEKASNRCVIVLYIIGGFFFFPVFFLAASLKGMKCTPLSAFVTFLTVLILTPFYYTPFASMFVFLFYVRPEANDHHVGDSHVGVSEAEAFVPAILMVLEAVVVSSFIYVRRKHEADGVVERAWMQKSLKVRAFAVKAHFFEDEADDVCNERDSDSSALSSFLKFKFTSDIENFFNETLATMNAGQARLGDEKGAKRMESMAALDTEVDDMIMPVAPAAVRQVTVEDVVHQFDVWHHTKTFRAHATALFVAVSHVLLPGLVRTYIFEDSSFLARDEDDSASQSVAFLYIIIALPLMFALAVTLRLGLMQVKLITENFQRIIDITNPIVARRQYKRTGLPRFYVDLKEASNIEFWLLLRDRAKSVVESPSFLVSMVIVGACLVTDVALLLVIFVRVAVYKNEIGVNEAVGLYDVFLLSFFLGYFILLVVRANELGSISHLEVLQRSRFFFARRGNALREVENHTSDEIHESSVRSEELRILREDIRRRLLILRLRQVALCRQENRDSAGMTISKVLAGAQGEFVSDDIKRLSQPDDKRRRNSQLLKRGGRLASRRSSSQRLVFDVNDAMSPISEHGNHEVPGEKGRSTAVEMAIRRLETELQKLNEAVDLREDAKHVAMLEQRLQSMQNEREKASDATLVLESAIDLIKFVEKPVTVLGMVLDRATIIKLGTLLLASAGSAVSESLSPA